MQQQVSHSKEILAQANTLIDQIQIKESEYTTLEAERKKTPFIFAAKRKEISAKLQELAEEIEELKSEKDRILPERFNCNSESDLPLIQNQISESEKDIDRLVEYESEYAEKYHDSLNEYKKLENETTEYDSTKLQKARLSIRDKKEDAAEVLREAADCLKPGGVMLAAVENETGVRYWMGAPKQENSYLESEFRSLLEDLKETWGGSFTMYYPVPDYR